MRRFSIPAPLAFASALSLAAALAGCSNAGTPVLRHLPNPRNLPFIHKIDVQQGNVVTQDMVAQLEPQMEKKKVQFIMGTPIVHDTFNADRWDYIYTYQPGGGDRERRQITLYFKDDKLDHIGGDITPAESPLVATVHHDTTVEVPDLERGGFMARLKKTIPFTGDEAEDQTAHGDDGEAAAEGEAGDDGAAKTAAKAPDDGPKPVSPYANIQEAPGEGIVVPPDAPRHHKKKGFLARLFDSIGLGAGEDEEDDDEDYGPGRTGYRDVTNPDDL